MGQNGGVTSWAEIESAPQQARAASSDRSAAGRAPRRPPVRLKRTDRIIVGSIDTGAHVLQRRARHLLLGAAVFMLPMAALQLFMSVFAWSRFDQIEGLMGDHGYLGAERSAALQRLTQTPQHCFGRNLSFCHEKSQWTPACLRIWHEPLHLAQRRALLSQSS